MKRRLLRFYNGRISRKVTIVYLVLAVMIIVTMTIISSLFIPKIFLENYLVATNNSFAVTSTMLANTINSIDLSISTLVNSKSGEFYTLLSEEYQEYSKGVKNYLEAVDLLNETVSMATPNRNMRYMAYLIVDENLPLHAVCYDFEYDIGFGKKLYTKSNYSTLTSSSSAKDMEWFRQAQKKWDDFYWFTGEDGLLYGAKQYFVVDENFGSVAIEYVGVICIVLDPSVYVEQICSAGRGTENAVITFRLSDTEMQIGDFSTKGNYYVYETLVVGGMDMVVQMPCRDVDRFAYTYVHYLLLVSVVILFGVCLIVLYISRSITKPIVALSEHMKSSQILTAVSVEKLADDEIKDIYMNYNELLHRVAKLITEKEAEVERRKEQEFILYQLQINPHFLYNTLNTISCCMMLRGENDMVEVLGKLSKYLRYNYSLPKDEVTIAEEIEELENYIQIQNLKYQERIIFQSDIAVEHLNYKICKMLLQPLVENAINYELGLHDDGPMRIRLYSYVVGNKIHLCVANDVICEDVERINEHIAGHINISRHSGGLGTRNINDRLRLKYGEECGLQYFVSGDETVACLIFLITE